jgi:hypothetical protein
MTNQKNHTETEKHNSVEPKYQNAQQILQMQVVPQRQLPSLTIPKESTPVNSPLEHESAGALMRRLADTIMQWREQLPEDEEPAILAILSGGIQINVERLAQESFNGIRIEGTMNGSPCMLLAHQSTVQMLCFVQQVEEPTKKRRIGFIIEGQEEEV